ncbi:hypothetical protein [Microbacterium hominis]|uniref:Uncharacterized protein n=1 Tax=Microbacterium hominis TaxID=162426 RepID=A0A7D4PVR7_9MICO|nr:hypothetical protein [Microbacterium hominis]QKJ20014.1 hypothetical protein HQM25_12050 [Microbacterium hominis]
MSDQSSAPAASAPRRRWIPWAIAGGMAGAALIAGVVIATTPGTDRAPQPSASASASASTPTAAGAPPGCVQPLAVSWQDAAHTLVAVPTAPEPSGARLTLAGPATADPADYVVTGTTVDDGLVLVHQDFVSPGSGPERLMLVEMPSAEVRWEIALPGPPASPTQPVVVGTPHDTGGGEIVIAWQGQNATDLPVTTLTSYALDDGSIVSSVEVDDAALPVGRRIATYNGSFSQSFTATGRDGVIVLGGIGSTWALDPRRLETPLWQTENASFGSAVALADIVLADGRALARGDGTPLGWEGSVPREEAGGLLQVGGFLVDTGDGSTIVRVDPATGSACGEPQPLRYAVTVDGGWLQISDDDIVRRYDAAGEQVATAGTVDPELFYDVVAGRLLEFTADTSLARIHALAGEETVDIALDGRRLFAYDDDRVLVLDPGDGRLSAYDLDTGAESWSTSPAGELQVWAGHLVAIAPVDAGDRLFEVTVLRSAASSG